MMAVNAVIMQRFKAEMLGASLGGTFRKGSSFIPSSRRQSDCARNIEVLRISSIARSGRAERAALLTRSLHSSDAGFTYQHPSCILQAGPNRQHRSVCIYEPRKRDGLQGCAQSAYIRMTMLPFLFCFLLFAAFSKEKEKEKDVSCYMGEAS